jgi:hypothetical protein
MLLGEMLQRIGHTQYFSAPGLTPNPETEEEEEGNFRIG